MRLNGKKTETKEKETVMEYAEENGNEVEKDDDDKKEEN